MSELWGRIKSRLLLGELFPFCKEKE